MPLMASIAVGSKILGGIGKIGASRKQKKANKQGRDIAYANIETQRKQNTEAERRAKRQVNQVEGTAEARSAASGFALGGQNAQSVLGTLTSENKRQLEWLQLSNQTMLDSMKTEADFNYQTGKAQSEATMWGGIADFGGAAATYDSLFPGDPKTAAENPFALKSSGGFIRPKTRPARRYM